ncbi:MAG: protein kinase [Paludisphaera borealis]|uniref:serine/threonine-protein kinase n=1 Tax=Paludisphaera borealis TaxID=1387353 RepID=UPI002842348D|nr:protein kinase [Paludisphaera borealis]MDR3622743.1 protein kinase [Paludisphaera borealis]
MTLPIDQCPDEQAWLAFHHGESAEDDLDGLAAHLEACASCSERLAEIEGRPDPILDALRRGGGAPPPTSRTPEAGSAVPGYEVLELLGAGGMGVVHKARHLRLGRLTALKRLKTSSLFDLHRFRREAEAVAALQHPNVVQIYEVGDHDGQPYLALEYVAGGSLADFLQGRPQPPPDAAALVETLARAVDHAHRRGVVHRDLKPANILLQPSSEAAADPGTAREARLSDFTPKVSDFGIAKRLEEEGGDAGAGATRTGAVLGTPAYMAPEQAESRAVGPPADVYALGAILYELLTGRPPFEGEGSYDTLKRVVDDDPAPPSRIRPGLPRDVETICLKCLRKQPERRYGSAAELGTDLRRFLDGRPVLARPTPSWEIAWKWSKRRPATAAAVAVVQASLIVLAVGASWYNGKLREALGSTRAAELQAENNARLAIDAHKHLVEQVQTLLQEAPATRTLRKGLLETAVSGLQRVTGADAGGPLLSRAMAHQLLAEIHWELGRASEASTELERCRQVATDLLAVQPGLPDALDLLATALRRLGDVQLRGDRPMQAQPLFQQALDVAEAWGKAEPDNPRALLAVIEGYEHLGHAAHWVGDMAEARSALTRMRELTEARLADEPDDDRARRLLGSALDLLAGIDQSEGDMPSALANYKRSLDLNLEDERRRAARSGREGGEAVDGRTFRDVMVSLNNLAITYVQVHDFAAARLQMDAALDRARRWSARDPEDVQRRLDLIDALYSRSAVEQYDLKYAAAIPFLVEAQAMLHRLQDAGKLTDLPIYSIERREAVEGELETCRLLPKALADEAAVWSAPHATAFDLAKAKIEILLADKRPSDALATARRLLEIEPKTARDWLGLARVCSRIVEVYAERAPAEPPPEIVARLLDRGVAALERVYALSASPPTVDELQGDARLAALRRAPGYAALIARRSETPRAGKP